MIKSVDEIPKPNVQPRDDVPKGYYQRLLNADLRDAYLQKLDKFEIVGYDAKPDYLLQVAKGEAYNICKELIYDSAKKYVVKKLAKEFDSESIRCRLPSKFSPNPIFRFYGVTLKDGIKHIFCEIDYKAARDFKKGLLEDSRGRTDKSARRTLWV